MKEMCFIEINKKKMRTILILTILFSLFKINLLAQEIQIENLHYYPLNRVLVSEDLIPIIEMPTFDISYEKNKEIRKNPYDKVLIFAKVFDVEINIKQKGYLIENNEFKRWILGVKSTGAYSLNFTFSKFNIPSNAELYIYGSKKTSNIVAFTNIHNKESGILPIQPIEGDIVIFEYTEPKIVLFEGELIVGKVGHDYKNILKFLKDGEFGASVVCNVDINCTQGNAWQNEKQSVCRIMYNNKELCTGVLINNIYNNGTPFVLTANHCISTNAFANNAVFVFNYESPSCEGGDGSVSQFLQGATVRSTLAYNSSTKTGSDFTLLELSIALGSSYQPYYSGWNKNTIAATNSTGIHHPRGDVKKICIENNTLLSAIYDPPTVNINTNGDHWMVSDWDVGITEQGSSGSPLYNQNHRIVGQLHGGASECIDSGDNGLPDWYGKFSSSWTGSGTNQSRLQNWLDPTNTINELAGLRLIRYFSINSNTPVSGDIVKFDNVTIQGGSNVFVDFNERFESIGYFIIPVGATLNIQP